jgi:hypothetical protein
VAGSTAAHYTLQANTDQSTAIDVDAAVAGRRRLQPVFPGKLTFKPAAGQTIPTNPSATGAATIDGDLYLEISPLALVDLRTVAPGLGHPLVFCYLGVTLDSAFFQNCVLRALAKGSGYLKVYYNSTLLNSAADLSKHFAEGHYGIQISTKKNDPVVEFPALTAPTAPATTSRATFALGVRTTVRTAAGPAQAASIASQAGANVRAAPAFAPIPVSFLFRGLRAAASWATWAADDHAIHPLFAAFDAAEQPGPRWRRLRAFPRGPRGPRVLPLAGYDDVTARLADPTSGTTLASGPLSRVGERYEIRPDEGFQLTLARPSGAVNVSPQPTGPLGPSVTAAWAAAPAGNAVDVTADIPAVPPPLSAGVTLRLDCYDFGGRTFTQDGTEIAQQELVGPLQDLLRSLGFGTSNAARTPGQKVTYDIQTQSAVREFQREALTTPRMVANAAQTVAVTFRTGQTPTPAPDGVADQGTLAELQVWVNQGYRSTVATYATHNANREDDLGFAREDLRYWNAFATVEGGAAVALGTISRDNNRHDVVEGLSKTAQLTLSAALSGANAAQFAGARWEKRAACEVAANESRGFDALNTYDDAFLSLGLFQWTAGTGGGSGELPGICHDLAAADFQRLFGRHGLSLDGVQMQDNIPRGHFRLDGVRLTAATKKELRNLRWAHRALVAAQDIAFQRVQYDNARLRLQRLLTASLHWGGGNTTVGNLLSSELLRTMSLDQHVNRPAHVVPALNACIAAMLNPAAQLGGAGTIWFDDAVGPHLYRLARKLHPNNPTPASLTTADQPQVDSLRTDLECQLRELKAACLAANTSLLTATTVAASTAQQHDALALLYKWRREHRGADTGGLMTGSAAGAAARWQSIAGGWSPGWTFTAVPPQTDPVATWTASPVPTSQNTGTLGDLSVTPGVFQP